MRPIFLLSPAYCGGRRATMLMRPGSPLTLAARLRAGVLPIGEAFAFLSGLYFRGKLAYAERFAAAAEDGRGMFVITPTRGLLRPSALVSLDLLREFASVDVRPDDARYRAPLERDVAQLAGAIDGHACVVLLGSIATAKYVDVLAAGLGSRLFYPPAFIGRGDMSRGGLLLRAAQQGQELDYAVLDPAAKRRGRRPPRLGPPSAPIVTT